MKKTEADRNKPGHAWNELSLRDGKIIRGAKPKPESEYMATPEVTIVGKKEALVDVEEGGRTSYAFKLSTEPDSMWRHLLAVQVEDLPEGLNRSDIRVEVREDTLFLLCMPSNLEAKYAFVKTVIARTNQEYQQEADLVRQRVTELEGEKKQETSSEKTKVEMVKDRFDKLEL